jgi:hypothetical protein
LEHFECWDIHNSHITSLQRFLCIKIALSSFDKKTHDLYEGKKIGTEKKLIKTGYKCYDGDDTQEDVNNPECSYSDENESNSEEYDYADYEIIGVIPVMIPIDTHLRL